MKDIIINRFREIHGGNYDYSSVEYKTLDDKVTIKCNKHSIIFEQTPRCHLNNKSDVCKGCIRDKVIEQFKKIHSNRYDYSEVEYTGWNNKVKIICKEHGVFEQTPDSHKRGQGCPECTAANQDEVIEQFKLKHGDRYDYNLVEYINAKSKVNIICKKHGIFEQIPASHKQGQGCPKCTTANQDEVIKQFKETHGDMYDYNEVDYINNKTKVKIICKKHGVFEKTPDNHKRGQGCPKCSELSRDTVIKQFKETHGDRYDYSEVEYAGLNNKVKIICKKHGMFEQRPNDHKRGSGCPKCTSANRNIVIKQFKETHGDRYDYNEVNYIKNNIKVKIICKKHGVFEQRPDDHKRGHGCPHCANELTYVDTYTGKPAILYYVLVNNTQYKVGITKTSVNDRYKNEIKNGIDIKVLREITFPNGYDAFVLEQEIIRKSLNRGTVLKEECILFGGYSEVRTSDFLDVFDQMISNYKLRTP